LLAEHSSEVVRLSASAGVHVAAFEDSARRTSWGKRVFDILLSAFLLLVLAPVLLIVGLAIYLHDRGPVIYRQRRVGRNNREFTIWKFRSMVPGADRLNEQYACANVGNGLLFKIPDDPRVTPVGNLIRRLSIDELPQLFNVLMGDMSLVGPRPLPVAPEDFDGVAARRHLVRPGITGPWQIAGCNEVGYDDMIRLDLTYVATRSFHRDIWLILRTIPAVLVRRSLY
jgi:lipopolysaccharide/colanic/teichoic acid biosynthesis glycosyltransferase